MAQPSAGPTGARRLARLDLLDRTEWSAAALVLLVAQSSAHNRTTLAATVDGAISWLSPQVADALGSTATPSRST